MRKALIAKFNPMLLKKWDKCSAIVFTLIWSELLWAQEETTVVVKLWSWEVPSGMTLIWLFAGLLLTVILIFGMYRVLLKGQIQSGVHPHILGWTLGLFFSGLYLLIAVFVLFNLGNIGLGFFAIIAGVILFAMLIMLFLGKVMPFLWFFVVIAAAFIIFQLVNV
jgi:hypothetical protein